MIPASISTGWRLRRSRFHRHPGARSGFAAPWTACWKKRRPSRPSRLWLHQRACHSASRRRCKCRWRVQAIVSMPVRCRALPRPLRCFTSWEFPWCAGVASPTATVCVPRGRGHQRVGRKADAAVARSDRGDATAHAGRPPATGHRGWSESRHRRRLLERSSQAATVRAAGAAFRSQHHDHRADCHQCIRDRCRRS